MAVIKGFKNWTFFCGKSSFASLLSWLRLQLWNIKNVTDRLINKSLIDFTLDFIYFTKAAHWSGKFIVCFDLSSDTRCQILWSVTDFQVKDKRLTFLWPRPQKVIQKPGRPFKIPRDILLFNISEGPSKGMTFLYSKPRISRIQVDRFYPNLSAIYPRYAKIRLMRSEIKGFGTIVPEILSEICEDLIHASPTYLRFNAFSSSLHSYTVKLGFIGLGYIG